MRVRELALGGQWKEVLFYVVQKIKRKNANAVNVGGLNHPCTSFTGLNLVHSLGSIIDFWEGLIKTYFYYGAWLLVW